MRSRLDNIVRYLRGAVAAHSEPDSDQDLLHRYALEQEEAAFAVLMRRHGPLVWSVCRRILHDPSDAEDAFQGTFLVLARRAATVHVQCLSAWLYGVATRVSLRARTARAKRHSLESNAMKPAEQRPHLDDSLQQEDVRGLLDEELIKLPRKYRETLVLCYLKGHTQDEVSAQLNTPRGSIARWLSEARDLLRARLERRGVVLSVGLSAILAEQSVAAVPARLADISCQAAILTLRGAGLSGVVSGNAITLADEVIRDMMPFKLKWAAWILAVVAVLGSSVALARRHNEPNHHAPAIIRLSAPTDVAHVTYSQDGKYLVAGGLDQVTVFDTATGNLVKTFGIPRVNVEHIHVSLSADGQWLAALLREKTVYLWNLNGEPKTRTCELDCESSFLVFAPDGKRFAAAAKDPRRVTLWDVESLTARSELPAHDGEVTTVAFQPNGTMVVFGGKTVRLWNAEKLLPLDRFDLRSAATQVAFSSDGKHFACQESPDTLSVYDFENRETRQSVSLERIVDFGFAADGQLQVVNADPQLRFSLWRVDLSTLTKKRLLSSDAGAWAVRCSPKGDTVSAINLDASVTLWRTN